MDRNLVLKPSAIMSICLIFIIGSIILSIPLYFGFLAGIVLTSTVLYKSGYHMREIYETSVSALKDVKRLLIVILFIGATTSIWLASGVVPTIMYYGFTYMEGVNFLLAVFLITSVVSYFLGTAIGTISTVGISLSGIGLSIGIPHNLMVGVLVSGAFIADKISPLSGLVNLGMTTVNRNYKELFKSMIITLIPAIAATSVIYFIIGSSYIAKTENLIMYKQAIQEGFNTSPALFILPAVILILSISGLDSLKTFSIGIGVGAILSIIFQQESLLSIIKALIFGYRGNTPSEELNRLLLSGGMISMIEAIFIVAGAYLLIKLFEKGNVLVPLMDKLVYGINNKMSLIGRTGLISILMTVATCDQTSGIILPGTILQEKYKELKLDNAVLARTIFDTGVIVAPLMPWNINSFLIKPVMGITAAQYAPFAVLCIVCPLITMLVSYFQYRNS
ncbi:MAG: sodium:proton antiporter [Tissierellia bacterium]|nr:sodium:proton antiporter [Tissierellia bacterium]HAS91196.1 sodium:proton antiporter [Clostridiales bacterium]HOA19769.1 Na+/H+ antiporter NhaC family protein [Sedimentibacter sp.]HOG62960.1 Na+/H+ antiporter NhaC family protein [Sedimentibacter sp.]HPV85240.1 Na+/H+ antiporter NhaC family protein [Sedimentibacter sp.]